jgi:hypothetical protein
MILAIHQPEHAVYGGYIEKMRRCDLFVILDTVQFSKNYFHNRNRIGTEENPIWITVPVKKHSLKTSIKDIQIASVPWKEKYLGKLRNQYFRKPHFPELYEEIREIIEHSSTALVDFNMVILEWMREKLNVKTPIVMASSLGMPNNTKGNALVTTICRRLGASRYIAGVGGKNYLVIDDFKNAGIELEFNEWQGSKLSSYDAIFRT